MTLLSRTLSKNDEHVDERAYPFFSYQYSGSGKRDWSWNSLSDGLRKTTVLTIGYEKVCAYCGRRALPIQKSVSSAYMGTEYHDMGECCVCKDAMDELEIKDKVKELRKEMEQAIRRLESIAPPINPDVVSALIDANADHLKKEVERNREYGGVSPYTLDQAGIKIREGDTE